MVGSAATTSGNSFAAPQVLISFITSRWESVQQSNRGIENWETLLLPTLQGFFFSLHRVSKANFPVYRDGTGTEWRLRICCQRTSKQIQLEIFSLPLSVSSGSADKASVGIYSGKKKLFKLKIEGLAASSIFIWELLFTVSVDWTKTVEIVMTTWKQTKADLWKVLLFHFYGLSVMSPPCAGLLSPPPPQRPAACSSPVFLITLGKRGCWQASRLKQQTGTPAVYRQIGCSSKAETTWEAFCC